VNNWELTNKSTAAKGNEIATLKARIAELTKEIQRLVKRHHPVCKCNGCVIAKEAGL
jgi:hypothetical protein